MNIEKLYESQPKLNKSDVETLQNWIETQPHLPKNDEKMVILLLNACEFNLKKAKKCIEYYYTIRASFPALFSNRDPELPLNTKMLDITVYESFVKLSPKGHAVFYAQFLDSSVDNYDFCTHMKLMDMGLHAVFLKFGCVEGIELICNMDGATWRHWQKMGLMDFRKGLGYLMEGFPVRLKGVHIVNPLPFLNTILTIIYPFLTTEIKQIINIYNDVNLLFDVLPKDCIPNELNGTGGSIEELQRSSIQTLRMNREYFIDDERFKSDESKRVKVGFWNRLGF